MTDRRDEILALAAREVRLAAHALTRAADRAERLGLEVTVTVDFVPWPTGPRVRAEVVDHQGERVTGGIA